MELSIRKAIPVTGGMAGGSADAAGALLACAVLWDLDISPEALTPRQTLTQMREAALAKQPG